MAKPATAPEPVPADMARLVGDYTCTTDRCLYRVGYAAWSLQLSRCCRCGPDPAADVFSPPFPITEPDLRRLLDYGSFHPAAF